MISFQGNFINNNYIKKCGIESGVQKDYKVAFVRLIPEYKNDCDMVRDVSRSWNDDHSLAVNISVCMQDNFEGNYGCYKKGYFALTSQLDNFENLIPDKVLALAQGRILNKSVFEIDDIVVNPKHRTFSPERKFKNIGYTMIKSIKEFYNNYILKAIITAKAKPFYEKIGFNQVKDYIYILK